MIYKGKTKPLLVTDEGDIDCVTWGTVSVSGEKLSSSSIDDICMIAESEVVDLTVFCCAGKHVETLRGSHDGT